MPILPALAVPFQGLFPRSNHGQERARWFLLTLQAILLPITASRTSHLLRTLATLCGVVLGAAKYSTFMASVQLPWAPVWAVRWRAIPAPLTAGRWLVALDDAIKAKTGTQVFACPRRCDPAAKTHHSRLPWAPTLVTVGLLKVLHGRGCGLPLAFAGYLRRLPAPGDAGAARRAPPRSGAHLRDPVHPSRAPDPDPRRGLAAGADPGGHRQRVRQQRLAQAVAPGARLPCPAARASARERGAP